MARKIAKKSMMVGSRASWVYKGVDVYPASSNSSGVRWYARTDYGILRADTRDGMKQLIRDGQKAFPSRGLGFSKMLSSVGGIILCI